VAFIKKKVLMLIIIGAIIRLALAFMYHPSGDACVHLSVARFISEFKEIPFLEPGWNSREVWAPPLFHIALALAKSFFGEFAMKLVSPVCGIIGMIFGYKITRLLFNKRIAFYSLFFLTFVPIMLFSSTIAYVDSFSLMLMMLAIYFALRKNVFGSAVFSGLSVLSKYYGLFVLPVVLYILFKKKVLFKNGWRFFKISLPISSLWFIRNWFVFGNPIYPFLSQLFGIEVAQLYTKNTSLINLFSLKHVLSLFLNLFGVPEGKFTNLFFFDFPYIKIIVGIWLLGTVLFLLFVFVGLKRFKFNTKWKILLVWFCTYAAMILAFIVHNGYTRLRYGIGIIPVVAILWALGFDFVLKKVNKKWIVYGFVILCAVGFTGAEFTKTYFASQSWDYFQDDFDWIKENTSEDSLVYIRKIDCIHYNTYREVSPTFEQVLDKGGYYWVKDEIEGDDCDVCGWLPKVDVEKYSNNLVLVYNNTKTQSLVYEVISVGEVS